MDYMQYQAVLDTAATILFSVIGIFAIAVLIPLLKSLFDRR